MDHHTDSPYKTLGLDENASLSAVKAAYKKLALNWHPDKNAGTPAATEQFKKISDAYQTITVTKDSGEETEEVDDETPMWSDPLAKYAEYRDGMTGPQWEATKAPHGFGGPIPPLPKAREMRSYCKFTLRECFEGIVKHHPVKVMVRCPTCDGSGGSSAITKDCPACSRSGIVLVRAGPEMNTRLQKNCRRCGGTGRVHECPCMRCNGEKRVPMRVQYPILPWIGHMRSWFLEGKGHDPAHDGEQKGDIYITVIVEQYDQTLHYLAVHCHDLIYRCQLSPGGEDIIIKAPNFHHKFPVGSYKEGSHDPVVFKGKGLPKNKTRSEFGDVLVFVVAEDEEMDEMDLAEDWDVRQHPMPPGRVDDNGCPIM